MKFRKQPKENLKQNGKILVKSLPNATSNSKISFEYELKADEILEELKINL